MNPTQPSASATWRGRCVACDQPFTEWGWSQRHDVSDDDARRHELDPGTYHDICCPLQECANVTEVVAS